MWEQPQWEQPSAAAGGMCGRGSPVLALPHLRGVPVPSALSPAFPVTTPEPLVLVTPPRCLTANRTQQGVLLSWLPPANHSFPIDRYIMEFRVAEKWEILDDGIPGSESEFFAKDLSQVSRGCPHHSQLNDLSQPLWFSNNIAPSAAAPGKFWSGSIPVLNQGAGQVWEKIEYFNNFSEWC